MIVGLQIRAARAMLRWTAAELGRNAGVSLPTIQRIERFDGVPTSRGDTLSRIEDALMAGGIEFIGGSTEAPGVCWHGKLGSRPSR